MSRDQEGWALPNAEIFHVSRKDMIGYGKESVWWNEEDDNWLEAGWYYWYCFPGCLPDSDLFGPFATEEEAITEAREDNDS